MPPRPLASLLSISAVLFLALGSTLLPAAASAQGTHLWTQSTFDDFERGKAESVTIRSDGAIEAGPALTSVLTTPSTYVWSVASDKSGNAYLGTGSPATVLKVSPDGKSTKLFESKDLSVQVVRMGPDGSLYAATLPSGKVFKIATDGATVNDATASVVFDPAATEAKPKYVWDLAFDSTGRLYVAAGGPAAVYRVGPSTTGGKTGVKPEIFFSSDEQHIRCIAFAPDGSLIAGSDGGGLIYRVGKDGKGFVLYDSPKHEITALTIAPNGTIYAAGVGEKGHSSLPPLPVQGIASVTITIVQPGSVQASNGNTLIPEGSEVYELAPDSAPRKLWSGHDDIVYDLRWTLAGLLAATGNRGRIYRIEEDGTFADLGHVEASQAVGFAEATAGFFVGTSNTGKLYKLSAKPGDAATYTSIAFDAGLFAKWGRAEVDSSGSFDLYARAGNIENPERAWSDWKRVTPGASPLGVPAARFIQWKAVLRPGAAVSGVGLNFLPVNAAPVVDDIAVQPGARVQAPSPQPPSQQTMNINFGSSGSGNAASFSSGDGTASGPLAALKDKTAVTIRWAAHDDNGDDLVFAVYVRGMGDPDWRLLKDKVAERYYSFDSATLPDGRYQLKVVASDAPSHNPGEALTAEKASDHFLVDTTAPVISNLKAAFTGATIHITADAVDSASPVAHAEYSVDAGPWQYVEPVGGLSDSLGEHYDFAATLPVDPAKPQSAAAQDHLVTVRVYDRYDNVATAKTVAAK